VVVGEFVDFLEEAAQRFRVAVGQVGVLEDVAEQGRDAGVFGHLADGFAVQASTSWPPRLGAISLAQP
jgi:hypothetical protein